MKQTSGNPLLNPEKAFLVGLDLSGHMHLPIEESMAELAELAKTAGLVVRNQMIQTRAKPDIRTYLGAGKLTELKALVLGSGVDVVIFDGELTPAQAGHLEEELGIKIIDRTELILSIFAQRAQSREGKLQVELAQLEFRVSHLTGKGVLMSRLGGGVGTRGPGETKLEVDRRRIRDRISILKGNLTEVQRQRETRRKSRRNSKIPMITILGYTNAGKSTLFNRLTKSGVLVEDKLFATLDPTVRRLRLPKGSEVLLTDTVGFIQKLPTQLISAFRATLEEVLEADLLVLLIDASHPYFEDHILATRNILKDLEAGDRPIVYAFNKMDAVKNPLELNLIAQKYEPSLALSALTGDGVSDLLAAIEKILTK